MLPVLIRIAIGTSYVIPDNCSCIEFHHYAFTIPWNPTFYKNDISATTFRNVIFTVPAIFIILFSPCSAALIYFVLRFFLCVHCLGKHPKNDLHNWEGVLSAGGKLSSRADENEVKSASVIGNCYFTVIGESNDSLEFPIDRFKPHWRQITQHCTLSIVKMLSHRIIWINKVSVVRWALTLNEIVVGELGWLTMGDAEEV